jgi:hypothetical protein
MTREQRIEAVLDRFGKYIVQQARANLTRKNKNVSKDLYNSIKWESDASKTGASFSASLSMLPYGDFQDKGVRGTDASPINTAKSPFRFGKSKGSGKKQGGLSDSINKWVRARRFQFRDKKGKFMSYDSTAFLVARSIYRKGIPATFFYSRPFGLAFQKLPAELVEAFRLTPDDFKEFLRK